VHDVHAHPTITNDLQNLEQISGEHAQQPQPQQHEKDAGEDIGSSSEEEDEVDDVVGEKRSTSPDSSSPSSDDDDDGDSSESSSDSE
jgi:hypothetical protein